MSTQVESRLPTLQTRRSLLPAPKSVTCALRSSELKPPHLSPTSPSVSYRHLVIGQRVETNDGRTGTLRFKGKTHFAQGCLCGIALDEPTGKHDGSVDGIHYFECQQHFGIFVPVHKVNILPPSSPASSATSTISQNSSTSVGSRDGKEKDSKPSSRIPTLGFGVGKLPRPKTLPVFQDSTTNSKLKPNKRSSKNFDSGRGDSSSEKSSTTSKLFQSKKISPVHTNITQSGWTGDNRTKKGNKRTSDTHNIKLKPNQNNTFSVVDKNKHYAKVNTTQDKTASRSSTVEQSSTSLLQRKLARNKNVKGKLSSRPSLNDLTRAFEEEKETKEERKGKPDIVEGCYPKLNETYELDKEVSALFQNSHSGSVGGGWDDSHSLSPLEDSSSGREKSDSSLAWDFEVPQSSTPVQIHLQVSSDIRTSIPEEPRIYPLGIGATAPAFPVDSLSSCDTENTDEEIEYNEFLAIPSFLDTPTGRCKFDLLTPEELEQALNEYNLLPDELQDAVDFEPQFSDVKPRIWEPITTVEDEFFRESNNALFTVPLMSMDPALEEKYSGVETPPVNSQAATPIGIASNGMETDLYPMEFSGSGAQRDFMEYPAVLPTPSQEQHSGSTGSGTIVNYGSENVQSRGASSENMDTTLVDNPSSMDDGVDLSEDFEMEVDPHNTTYDIDVDGVDKVESESQSSTFVIEKCPEKRSEGDGQEVHIGMHYEGNKNNNGKVPTCMSPVDLLEGTPHLKSVETMGIPDSVKRGGIVVSSGTDTEVVTSNGTTKGRIVMSTTTKSSSVCYAVTTEETPKAKLERIMMDTEEDLKFRMDEMAAEASMVSSVDENKSVESECSRTESERATDSPDLHTKVYRQPSAELQAVMEVGMSLTSQNEHPLTNGVRSGIKESGNHTKEGDEKKDEEKPNGAGKRKSLLLTPKKVSARITQSNNYQVTVNKPKPATSSTSGRPSSAQSNSEKDNKKTYTPSSWRNDKNSNGTTKVSVIPRRKSVEGKTSRASDVKNHVNTGRYSADAAHLVQKLQPILDVKNKAESTSSMEVDPGSISSSNRSMRSELTMSSNTSKTSAKAATNGKPVNKATLSLRHSSDRRHERKPSSSSMASDHSQRTGSRASVASRPSSRSDGSREVRNTRRTRSSAGTTNTSGRQVFVSKPAPTSTTQTKARVSRTTGGKSSTRTSQGTTGTTTTTVDAAPSRKTAIPGSKKTSTPGDQQTKKSSVTQKDSIPNGRPGSKSKPHPLGVSTSPPDLVYTSLVNGEASLEIKRLESLCESRTKELGAARLQLKQTVQGFDAMSVLVQYLTQEVNAFSVPKLKRQCEELEKEVSITSAKLAHQRDEITRLQDQLDIEAHNHQEEKLRLDHLHREEVKGLEETLRAKHAKDLQTLDNKHTQEIRQLHDDHQQEMCDMTASHQSLIRDIEDQHAEHISQMNQSHLDHLEEVIRDKDEEIEVIKHDAEVKIRELQDEVFKWKYQCDKQTTRTLELEEALQKDDDTKVQAAIAQYKHLPDEVESMKAVLEIKSTEIHELRKCKMALEKELDTIPAKDERIKLLSAKVEDLSALMQRKTEYERQLSSEHVHLRESYERESHVNKRLSMENEELMWKLNQSESTSPGCLTPPPPLPRYRAMSSPSHSGGGKTGFSRSSSTESHESGVFSPNHPQ